MLPISQSTASEHVLQRTPLQKKDQAGRVGHVFFEFNLPANAPEQFTISFQNYYVSTVLFTQESKAITEPIRLMKSAYNEAEAQHTHSIHSSSFKTKVNKMKPIRATLFQPSSLWSKLDLRELKMIVVKEDLDKMKSSSSHQSTTLSSLITADVKLLNEATKQQSHMKNLPEVVYTSNTETKRTSKRKEKKKEKKMQMPANPPDAT